MLIVNADDWGGWTAATNAALACFQAGRVASVSAMVFMEDSTRAATMAHGTDLDVGLHINLDQHFTGANCGRAISAAHDRVSRFLRQSKYAQLIYNPLLRADFRVVFDAQVEEFQRLYDRSPSHFDGHHHMHLCANMILDNIIPEGEKVRRSFSHWPGQRGLLKRQYRRWVDYRLGRRFVLTDHFVALSQCMDRARFGRIVSLAQQENVELLTHPEKPGEFALLMSDDYAGDTRRLKIGSFVLVQ
jgi:hypothetical protein